MNILPLAFYVSTIVVPAPVDVITPVDVEHLHSWSCTSWPTKGCSAPADVEKQTADIYFPPPGSSCAVELALCGNEYCGLEQTDEQWKEWSRKAAICHDR